MKGGRRQRRTEKEVGRQHQGMDRSGVHQVPEDSGEPGKKEETGCEIICGAPTTLMVKGSMRRRGPLVKEVAHTCCSSFITFENGLPGLGINIFDGNMQEVQGSGS